ncbi:MAG: oligosaccharide flippase family protein [Betaproteobacteria bacterium]|nr:oligosaccharide flippase family protein [Betaproteobacteria bacterium]
MTAIRRNIVTNAVGGGWIVALTLLVIPVQIRILGSEAYGMIGVLATLQIVFSVLDLGAGATLVQRVATDATPNHQATRELLGAAAAVYCTIAVMTSAGLAWQADWLATHWFRLSELPPATVATGIQLIVVSLLLRCPTALCAAVISGLNRLDLLNLLKAGMQTLRLLGGLVVLLLYRDLLNLLWWEAAVSAAELVAYLVGCKTLVPGLSLWPRFSAGVVRENWRYALGMSAISVIALLLTQTDKIAISRFLPLESLGFYHLAYSATAWIALIQGGFNSAILPSFAADFGTDRIARLSARNNKITQLTVYTVTLPAAMFMFFSAEILGAWVVRDAALAAANVAAVLAAAFMLNAAASNCLTLAVASGRPGIPLRVNLLGLAIYLPALAILLESYGITGAAWAWAVLNAYYVLVLVPIVQSRILGRGYFEWLRGNFLPFVVLGVTVFGVARLLVHGLAPSQYWFAWAVLATAAACYTLAGYCLLERGLRAQIAEFARTLLPPQRSK